ncbi:hypothetical protein CCMA1212_001349 [Trichoderma ghanense]|uniref:Uncharacterized protein n=1 Tax=Trichoderma ghanense TaxID=65468 RepID=A0ABY2HE45_9HYPO
MLESKHRRLEQIGSASSDARLNECLLHRYIWQKSPRDLNDVQTTGSGQGIEYLVEPRCDAALASRPGEAVAVRKAASSSAPVSLLPLSAVRPGFPRDEAVAYHRSVAGACSLHGMAWHGMAWLTHFTHVQPGLSGRSEAHNHPLTQTLTLTSPSPLFPASSKIRFVPFGRPLPCPPKRTVKMFFSSAIGARERAGDGDSKRRSRRSKERQDEDEQRRQERAAGF